MEKEEEFPERKEPVYEKQLPDYAVEYPSEFFYQYFKYS